MKGIEKVKERLREIIAEYKAVEGKTREEEYVKCKIQAYENCLMLIQRYVS